MINIDIATGMHVGTHKKRFRHVRRECRIGDVRRGKLRRGRAWLPEKSPRPLGGGLDGRSQLPRVVDVMDVLHVIRLPDDRKNRR